MHHTCNMQYISTLWSGIEETESKSFTVKMKNNKREQFSNNQNLEQLKHISVFSDSITHNSTCKPIVNHTRETIFRSQLSFFRYEPPPPPASPTHWTILGANGHTQTTNVLVLPSGRTKSSANNGGQPKFGLSTWNQFLRHQTWIGRQPMSLSQLMLMSLMRVTTHQPNLQVLHWILSVLYVQEEIN